MLELLAAVCNRPERLVPAISVTAGFGTGFARASNPVGPPGSRVDRAQQRISRGPDNIAQSGEGSATPGNGGGVGLPTERTRRDSLAERVPRRAGFGVRLGRGQAAGTGEEPLAEGGGGGISEAGYLGDRDGADLDERQAQPQQRGGLGRQQGRVGELGECIVSHQRARLVPGGGSGDEAGAANQQQRQAAARRASSRWQHRGS
mmetsp:Transcript_3140/g.7842  ORF Transcript_3140/g.7842 Transcript_3140/m.7842 type:complete len:204 (-) Transcript_3140:27-638(-)